MNFFDKMIDSFSASDLKKRVWWVVFVGLLLIGAVLFFGTKFMNQKILVSVQGAASLSSENSYMLKVELPDNEFKRFESFKLENIKVEVDAGKKIAETATIANIDPASRAVMLKLPISIENVPEHKMSARLLLLDKPYWKLLWDKI